MDSILSVIDLQVHRFDANQLGAIAIALTAVLALLLGCILIVAIRALWRVSELRDLERDGYIRHHDVLQAILRQVNTCASEIEQLKREMASYVTSRETQLEERKKILKSIAGHLTNASPRGG